MKTQPTHPKPVVGQILFHVFRGYRHSDTPRTGFATVACVGRKYFSVEVQQPLKQNVRFHLDNWRPEGLFLSIHELYPSEQTYKDKLEASELRGEIIRLANSGLSDMTLGALREVKKWLTKEKTA